MNTCGPSRGLAAVLLDCPAAFPAPPLAPGHHTERLPKATRQREGHMEAGECHSEQSLLRGGRAWGKFKGGRYCASFRQSSISVLCQLFLDDKPHEDRKRSCFVPSRTGFRVRSLQNRGWAALGLN